MLHRLHRVSACIIGSFVLLHLLNHLFLLISVEQHMLVMDGLRIVYRNPFVETFLLACILFQVSSGLWFVWRRKGKRIGFFEKAQVFSGLYLAFFLINHVAAVFYGRWSAQLDTNIYFGIAGFHTGSLIYFFAPYYFFAVLAIFVHLAAAFYWLGRNTLSPAYCKSGAYLIIFFGSIVAALLVLGFSGAFETIHIPPAYHEFLTWQGS